MYQSQLKQLVPIILHFASSLVEPKHFPVPTVVSIVKSLAVS